VNVVMGLAGAAFTVDDLAQAGVGGLERLEPADRVVEVGPAVEKVLGPRGEQEGMARRACRIWRRSAPSAPRSRAR
jgi:hypothetical protein